MAFERQHQAVAVDDAGRRRQVGRDAGKLRLEAQRFFRRQPLQVVDAVLVRGRCDCVELGDLAGLRCDEQLAATTVRDAVLGAKTIEQGLAGDAELGAQAARRVVEPGVDDLRVARARFRADAAVALEYQHLLALLRQSPGDGEADDSRSHHDRFNVCHGASCRWSCS